MFKMYMLIFFITNKLNQSICQITNISKMRSFNNMTMLIVFLLQCLFINLRKRAVLLLSYTCIKCAYHCSVGGVVTTNGNDHVLQQLLLPCTNRKGSRKDQTFRRRCTDGCVVYNGFVKEH